MVPKCKEGIREGKGGRETSVVQPSSASRAGYEVRFRGRYAWTRTGLVGWTVIRERDDRGPDLSDEDCWRHQKEMRPKHHEPGIMLGRAES
jgi:hypothetical protein